MADPKTPPAWYAPGYPPLTGEVGEAAIHDRIVTYPQVVRGNRDYPVPQQGMGLVSFMLFQEPKKLANGAPVYGFFKLRGNYTDADMAKAKAMEIIRNQDSKNKVKVAEVGAWLPITDDERGGIVQETIDVKVDDQDKLRETAIKEEKAKAERIMKELHDREKEVREARDYNEEPDSLDHYTMKRVAWLRIQETIELEKKKIESLEEKLKSTRKLLGDLDVSHPEYKEQWIENYNTERKKSGIPDYVPSEKQDLLYVDTK